MKILLVNKFHYLKGGSEKYYFELADLLKEKGHEVAFFSMFDEKNIKTDCKEYMVKKIDMNSKNIFKAFDVIYSKENKKKMQEALEDFKPDIVHINNFQRQLSASIIDAIKEKNIPIVFTAHDLQAVCPISAMLNNGEICEKCKGGKYYNCLKNKCTKNSTMKSMINMIEAYYYKNKNIYQNIDCIVTPSDFVKNKIQQNNEKIKKIVTIHNFIDMDKFKNYEVENEGYAIFSGRLSIEKGILNAVKAFKDIKNGKLYIAGNGPEKENIEKYIQENKLQDRIKLLGFLSQNELKKYLRKSTCLILPSIWYENCPYSIIEAFAIGKPVISTRIGGIPELVEENVNGYLYDYNNIEELTKILNEIFNDNDKTKQLGENAKKDAINKYSKDVYYNKLIKVYEKVL
mgnify:CR=1 FL=1